MILAKARFAARALALLAGFLLAGCAAGGDQPGPATPIAPPSAGERVALALAAADRAAQTGDVVALSSALAILDGLGAKPLDPARHDPLPAWRERAPNGPPPMRGRPLGPGYRSGTLAPGASERIEQLFLSGQRARIALAAPDRSQLELTVEDARQQPVCGSNDSPSRCQWVPLFTQRFTIEISNPGRRDAQYYLVVE